MNSTLLNSPVYARTTDGRWHAEGIVIAQIDSPALVIETTGGKRITWREDMCQLMSPDDQISYWRKRALAAENPQPEA